MRLAWEAGFGRPWMFARLFAADASHSAVGLVLVLGGKILCPVVALGSGWRPLTAAAVRAGW